MKVQKIEQKNINLVYKAYVKDISKCQPLRREEELVFWHIIHEGEDAVLQQLANAICVSSAAWHCTT